MSLTRLLIRDFRDIKTTDLALSPGFNFLVGANGSGKTSALEAIYTLGHGRVFRSLQIDHVIRHEQEAFVPHERLQDEEHETTIGLTKGKQGDSKVRVDGMDGHKVAELVYLMSTQLTTSEGSILLNGGPKYRRALLGWGCSHNEPGFFTAWSNLKRLLKQRNAALRQVIRYEQLRPWDKELIPLAEQISTWRVEYSTGIVADMADTCKQFLPESSLTFSFQRGWGKEAEYVEVLERNLERDRQLTYTVHDPYKADLHIHADGVPVEDTLSREQLKLLMCTLRLTQGKFPTRESGRRCLHLIDDFASELDDECRGLFASRLKATQSQIFVSAISVKHVIDMSDENSKVFTVEKGKTMDQPKYK